jgi:hypothetical protein
MTQYPLQTLKNRITERIHANRAHAITGIDMQEMLHDVIDSLNGDGGGDPGVTLVDKTDYGLVGALDGINTTFSTSVPYEPLSIRVYLNGVRQFRDRDYQETLDGRIIFETPPIMGDLIIADYQY